MILWLSLLFSIGFLLILEIKRQILSRRFRHIPGPFELPIFGSFYTFTPSKLNDAKTIFNIICNTKITKIFIGPDLTFFVSDPDVLQTILNGHNFTERPFIFDFFRSPYGVMTAKHQHWKPVRKALNPAFSHRICTSFIPIFEKHFTEFVHQVNSLPRVFDLKELTFETFARLILETNFGVENSNEIKLNLPLLDKCIDNVVHRITNPWLYAQFIYSKSSLSREDEALDREIRKFFRNILLRRSKTHASKLFIDEILKYTQGEPSDDALIQNMFTVFMAGYETSGLTLLYTILLLAMHPEIDEKLGQELCENYSGQSIDYELLKRFTYLEMVVKESMRLFPPAPTSARENLEAINIDKIGYIEKGTTFILNYYNLHRWTEIWGADAHKFNPENFSTENTEKRHPYAFLPFSGGPKICLAYQYAMISVKVGLIIILSQLKFTTAMRMEDFEFKFCPSLKIISECLVTAVPRRKGN